MTRRIAIVQGHPDPAGQHLLHAMADAYAEGATAAGHQVRRVEVAKLDFPLLRTIKDFETGALPPSARPQTVVGARSTYLGRPECLVEAMPAKAERCRPTRVGPWTSV
nr:NAD(P)H-dependent oxidoreductase [Mesorhizobium sp. M00.F.Ca.ET.216.01.1.1]